jgi:hypothetical protein
MKITGQQPPEFHGVKGGTAKENQKTTGRSGDTQGTVETPDKNSTFVMNKIKIEFPLNRKYVRTGLQNSKLKSRVANFR